METLITGASGFLGRHLSKRLASEGHNLTLLNSQTADLTRQGDLEEKLAGKNFDQIFHLASWSRAGAFCRENPGLQILVNQRIDVNVFDYWRASQPRAKMIAMGSSVAYDPALPLKEENYLRGEPIADYLGYGNAKKMLYANLKALNKQFGLDFMCFVPSTLYGPDYHTDGRPMHFIYDLARKMIRAKKFGEEVVLWGDGSQERELIHVEDFIELMLKINAGYKNEIVNIGSGKGKPIKDFAKIICEEIDYDFSSIKYDATKPTGAKSKYFDLTKMNAMYPGFVEKDTKLGIKETVKWMLENPKTYGQ